MVSRAVAFLGGGLLSGVGAGLIQEGKFDREEALRRMEQEFRGGEAEKDRSLRREEAATDRDFRAGQSAEDREFRGDEAEKDRGFRSSERKATEGARATESALDRTSRESEGEKTHRQGLLTGQKEMRGVGGEYYVRTPGETTAAAVTGADGKPIKGPVAAEYNQTRVRAAAVGKAVEESTDALSGAVDWGKVTTILRQMQIEPTEEIQQRARAAAAAVPKEEKAEPGWFSRAWDSLFGDGEAKKPTESPGAPEPKAEPKAQATGAGQPPKPAKYPDARYSERVKAWVVQRDGRWFKVE